jgi:hypothetical protein
MKLDKMLGTIVQWGRVMFVIMYVIFPKKIIKPLELIQKLNEKHQAVGTVPKSNRKIVEYSMSHFYFSLP